LKNKKPKIPTCKYSKSRLFRMCLDSQWWTGPPDTGKNPGGPDRRGRWHLGRQDRFYIK